MFAQRIENLPPYLFARIDEMKAKKRAEGVDVIDLGVGDPDLATPPHIVNALIEAAKNPDNHHYPNYLGMAAYRQAVAGFRIQPLRVELRARARRQQPRRANEKDEPGGLDDGMAHEASLRQRARYFSASCSILR